MQIVKWKQGKRNMKVRKLITFFATILLCVSCGEIIDPESVDEEYSVTYYAKPPHSKENQGYLYLKANGESDYIQLSPIADSPFTLFISVTDKKGQEAIDFIKSKDDSPITSMQDLNPGQAGTARTYRVVSTKYFQSRYFFVSECYSADGVSNIYVQPYITVKMRAGQDISTVEEEYKSVIRLAQENDDGTYLFSCSYKTSYEVLMLTTHIFDKAEVAWAEPSLQGAITISNK